MRALVTGGAGFVGSAVVRALLAQGLAVSCLVRRTSDLRNLAGLDVTLVEGDLADRRSLERAMEGCQQLYHVAAFYSTRPEDAQRMVEANVEGTRHALSAAADLKLERVVHTSTIGAIGRPADNRLPTEGDAFTGWENASPYARSKIEAERVALEYARQGLSVVVVNPCAPVGAGDYKPSSTGGRILAYLRGRTPSFLAGGINFVSVEDVAQGHLLAARHGRTGERYILGHARGNLELADFYAVMEHVSGIRPPHQDSFAGSLGEGLSAQLARWRDRLGRLASGGKDLAVPRQTTTHAPDGDGLMTASRATDYRPAALTANPERAIRELGLPQTPLDVAFREAVDWFRSHHYVQ